MRWVSKVKDVFENIDRSILLGVGLVIIAVLVAATFIVGDTEQVAEENNNTDTQQELSDSPEATNQDTDESDSSGNTDDSVASSQNQDEQTAENGNQTGNETKNTSEQAPEQLADTGPVSAIAALALGAGGYVYHRSRRNLYARRTE